MNEPQNSPSRPGPVASRPWSRFGIRSLFALTALLALLSAIWSGIKRLGDNAAGDVRVVLYVVLALILLPVVMLLAMAIHSARRWMKKSPRRVKPTRRRLP